MLLATTLCDLKCIQLPQFTVIALRSLPTLHMALVKGQNVIKIGKKWHKKAIFTPIWTRKMQKIHFGDFRQWFILNPMSALPFRMPMPDVEVWP